MLIADYHQTNPTTAHNPNTEAGYWTSGAGTSRKTLEQSNNITHFGIINR